jgi:hypothetical protein
MGEIALMRAEKRQLPCQTPAQNIVERMKSLSVVSHHIDASMFYDRTGRERAAVGIPEAKRILSSGEYNALVRDIVEASKPATNQQIRAALSQLVCAFPNAARTDLAAFGAVLATDITSMRPTAFAVDTACRKLRQTLKFVPSIAETMEAIRDEERVINAYAWSVERFPKNVRDAERIFAEVLRYIECHKQTATEAAKSADPLS